MKRTPKFRILLNELCDQQLSEKIQEEKRHTCNQCGKNMDHDVDSVISARLLKNLAKPLRLRVLPNKAIF